MGSEEKAFNACLRFRCLTEHHASSSNRFTDTSTWISFPCHSNPFTTRPSLKSFRPTLPYQQPLEAFSMPVAPQMQKGVNMPAEPRRQEIA
jgi:hypothetical protein